MLKHSLIFWVAIAASLATGIYGLVIGKMVIFIPYFFLNPIMYIAVTSSKKFHPIRRELEVIGALILFFNIPGSIILHDTGIQYDILLHFFAAFLGFWAIFRMLPIIFKNLRAPRFNAAILTIIGGFLFEGIQKLSDMLFNTHLFFDVIQPIALDFQIDILMDILGVIAGVIFLKAKPWNNQDPPQSK